MRENEKVQLKTESAFDGMWLQVTDARHASSAWLKREEAIHLAAQMLSMSCIVGNGASSIFADELQRFRDGISDLLDSLGDVKLASRGESCSVCGRVIFNAANMSRHFATHMKDGEVKDD